MIPEPDQNIGHAASNGVPVVFLSGMLADQRMWDRALRAYDRLERPSRPDILPVFCELFDQDSVADMAQAVLYAAPPKFALVGMSMGGYVAFEILRRAPDRITHLMLVNTRATADTEAVKRRRELLARIAARSKPFRGVNDGILDEMIHPGNRHDADLIGLLTRMAEDAGADVFIRQSRAVANRPDSLSVLPHITVPCSVMVGVADQVISPASHREMAERISGAKFFEVAGAGHYVPLEQPRAFADALCSLVCRSPDNLEDRRDVGGF